MPWSKVESRKKFVFSLHRKYLEVLWNCVWWILVRGGWGKPQNTEVQRGECVKKIQCRAAALEEKHVSGLKGSSVCPIILITERLHVTDSLQSYSASFRCVLQLFGPMWVNSLNEAPPDLHHAKYSWKEPGRVILAKAVSHDIPLTYIPTKMLSLSFLPLISIMFSSELRGWKLVHSCLRT